MWWRISGLRHHFDPARYIYLVSQLREKRRARRLELLFKPPRAIALATRPCLGAVCIATVSPRMRVLHAHEFKILLPIRALLLEWNFAKTDLHPKCGAIVGHTRALHVVKIFVTRNGAFAETTVFDGLEQRRFPAGFYPCSNEVSHAEILSHFH